MMLNIQEKTRDFQTRRKAGLVQIKIPSVCVFKQHYSWVFKTTRLMTPYI
jgi:hypothetical protein